MKYDELIDKIRDNLANMSYDDVASVYNDILGFEGSRGKKVHCQYYDLDVDEPEFVEEVDG